LDVHTGNPRESSHHRQHVEGGREEATQAPDLGLQGGGGVEEDLGGVAEEEGEGEGGAQGAGEPVPEGGREEGRVSGKWRVRLRGKKTGKSLSLPPSLPPSLPAYPLGRRFLW